ncbi:MAG: methionine--tRNA ligase [Candidatus Levybacteria bacterium]|nr:methionine--tRNA ligase [Candidatus Levybacteria bacterium]MBP9815272.1 methionine--tRNA ligase [Candidatus Levybacteria bacterium]
MISIDDLEKLDIRIGTIKQVETVPGSEKLYKEIVDFGPEIGEKQILSGIQKHFTQEDLIGKQALFIVNLEPREMMGFTSEGMLLAADGDNGPVLLTPTENVPNGSKIK